MLQWYSTLVSQQIQHNYSTSVNNKYMSVSNNGKISRSLYLRLVSHRNQTAENSSMKLEDFTMKQQRLLSVQIT